MRVFMHLIKTRKGNSYERWVVSLPTDLVRSLGWSHRDDVVSSVVDGELRLRKAFPRDRTKDRFPGGRYDPSTGELRGEVRAVLYGDRVAPYGTGSRLEAPAAVTPRATAERLRAIGLRAD